MKKLIATILTATFLVAIVATPSYKVNSPKLTIGYSVSGNKAVSGDISLQ